jgi:hypothetical protein
VNVAEIDDQIDVCRHPTLRHCVCCTDAVTNAIERL